jgi:hypothetical protein
MINPSPNPCRRVITSAAVTAVALSAAISRAQDAGRPQGLDALDDDVLISELANRQLSPLLDRYLERRQFPAEQRQAIRTLLDAMHALNRPAPLPAAERASAAAAVNANVDAVLPALRDPRFFLQLATVLIRTSVERDANTLEYWGPSAPLQLSLRPTVRSVIKALDKAAAEAAKERDAIAAAITPANQDALSARYVKFDDLATTAEYTRHMSAYYLALTYDPAAPERRQLATAAIEYLEQFDNPDSQVQPAVRLRLGKLHLVSGDHPPARKAFASVVANPDDAIRPPPDLSQQFEARYFAALTELQDNRLDEAARQLASLREWSDAKLPADNAAARGGASAAASIFDYRLLMARAEAAPAAADKQAFRDQARAVLNRLVADRPELRSIVYAQVLATMPPDADVDRLDPVMLAALVRQGDQERLKPADEKVNRDVLERALAAARELVKRRGQPAVSDGMVDSALLLQGFLLDRLERRPEAATALLDYLDTKPADGQNARLAMDTALAIVDQLRRVNRYDEATAALYRRALPVAIGAPFGRRELAYDYARSLQREGKYADAVSYFRQVPPDDGRLTSARFYEMLALKQDLDAGAGALPGSLRGQMVADIRRLADDVTAAATAAARDPAVPAERQSAYRELVAKSVLVAADTALRHQANPRRALQLLADFETRFADVPGHPERLADALLLRVNAHMDLNQTTEATGALVELLAHRSGGQGANIIHTLLQKLDADLDAARRAGNNDRTRALAKSRAALSGYLVDWAAKNPNPDVRKFTYRYRVFDAGTHHLAAQLEPDPAARSAALQASLKRYESLLSPDNHKEYLATLPPDAPDQTSQDPAVLLGIASVHFDRADYANAQPILARLLSDRRLGPARIPADDGPIDNDAYWQATCQLLRCNYELSRNAAPGTLDPTKAHLKRLYVEFGAGLGGPKWAPQFESLRKELTPDFVPPGS